MKNDSNTPVAVSLSGIVLRHSVPLLMLLVGLPSINAGELRFTSASVQFSEGIGIVRVPMERTNPVEGEQVRIQTMDVDALAGVDYVAIDEVFTFGATETDISIAVKILDNAVFQTDRELKLTLSNPVGLTLGSPSEISLIIADNDDLQQAGFGSSATHLYQGAFDQGPLAVTTNSLGRIILGGGFNTFNGQARNNIARLLSDGTIDDSFDPGAGANGRVWSIAVEADDQILVGGDFTSINATARNRIARLNNDGTVDAGFDPGTGANGTVESLEVMADGRILMAGFFSKVNDVARTNVAILGSDGTLESGFNTVTPQSFVAHIARRAGDQILLGGEVDRRIADANVTNSLMRFDLTGVRDTNFQVSVGDIFFNIVSGIAVQPDGRIVIGGLFSTVNGDVNSCIARLNTDGSLDDNFDSGLGADNWVFRVALQADGKILLAGWFENIDGQPRPGVARLNADGSLDGTFDPRGGANEFVYSAMPMFDGRVLLTGSFTKFDGYDRFRFAMLNPDGSLLTTPLSIADYSIQPGNEFRMNLSVEPGRDFRVFSTEDFGVRTSILTNQTARHSIEINVPNDGGPEFFYLEQGF